MTRKEQIENHFKGGEKTNKNMVALQTYVKNYIEDHYPSPYTQYEVMSDDDVESRASKALYDLFDDKPPFLLEFTSEEKYQFSWDIEFRYRSDIRGAFRRELYLIADAIRKARRGFKRSDYFSYDKETKRYTICANSPLSSHKFIEADAYYLQKDEYGQYDLFITRNGESKRASCFSSLIEAAHELPTQLEKSHSKLEGFLETLCHRGFDDLLTLCQKDYLMRRLSDKVIKEFIDSYERPSPRKYGVYKYKGERLRRFFVDINEEERLKLSADRGVADVLLDNLPYKEADALCDKLEESANFYNASLRLNSSVAKLALRLEEEQGKLDEAATSYLTVSQEISDMYNIKVTNEFIEAETQS
jgi:hypothetical protein